MSFSHPTRLVQLLLPIMLLALALCALLPHAARAATTVTSCMPASTSWRYGNLCATATLHPTCCNNLYLTVEGGAYVTGGLGGSGYVVTTVDKNFGGATLNSCRHDGTTGEGGPTYTLQLCDFSGFGRSAGTWTVRTCFTWDVKNDGKGPLPPVCAINRQVY